MIQPQDLRIGNLVNYICGEEDFYIIRSINEEYVSLKDNVSFDNVRYDEIEPIEITEEWLLKFGFIIRDKKYSLNYGGESMKYAVLETNIRNPFFLYFHGRFGFNINEGRKNGDYCIKHIHQLQNLYFALTGE